ncbi:putative transcription factor S [Monocercomonoides exilis]|uniref:putative transcription factor S n=1 Tax=Monocercomonoides exilis TaxID=2049356 RepID=UPI00355AA6BD|nr:putative transcription factor S [Monocercomonoides exilis]|eukprot:MONOS_6710.1-p1 / transcript=MONOS_6710.1 / gene=MONOS_6710 / organism=Monocercomonoides_exilis_PA203 / gene_product=transcription factor S / transcript_product=transcription factor S / location=Mono_scaffold00216:44635-45086(+) / protein_length=103 / sequence_SO=supercontig / SO=protein_coding / is_pseudo=false
MDFCNVCGTLLEYQSLKVVCRKCSWQCPYSTYKGKVSQKVIKFSVPVEEKVTGKDEKAVIDETCPKCGHGKMFYTTMQLRSADEGQTVFYECMKCGYRFSVNN